MKLLPRALALSALCSSLSACLGPVSDAGDDAVEPTEQALVASPKKVAYYPLWTSGGDDLVASFPQAPASLPWTKITHINSPSPASMAAGAAPSSTRAAPPSPPGRARPRRSSATATPTTRA